MRADVSSQAHVLCLHFRGRLLVVLARACSGLRAAPAVIRCLEVEELAVHGAPALVERRARGARSSYDRCRFVKREHKRLPHRAAAAVRRNLRLVTRCAERLHIEANNDDVIVGQLRSIAGRRAMRFLVTPEPRGGGYVRRVRLKPETLCILLPSSRRGAVHAPATKAAANRVGSAPTTPACAPRAVPVAVRPRAVGPHVRRRAEAPPPPLGGRTARRRLLEQVGEARASLARAASARGWHGIRSSPPPPGPDSTRGRARGGRRRQRRRRRVGHRRVRRRRRPGSSAPLSRLAALSTAPPPRVPRSTPRTKRRAPPRAPTGGRRRGAPTPAPAAGRATRRGRRWRTWGSRPPAQARRG